MQHTPEHLEKVAAIHRFQAQLAGNEWMWVARLQAAERPERQAADLRSRTQPAAMSGHGGRSGAAAVDHRASTLIRA
jgi:hypothetical protein